MRQSVPGLALAFLLVTGTAEELDSVPGCGTCMGSMQTVREYAHKAQKSCSSVRREDWTTARGRPVGVMWSQ